MQLLRKCIKSLLLEQEERKQSEEQEIDSIKDLFQHWINEYSASYLAFRKKVSSNSYEVTQISVKERNNFIYISLSFEELIRDDWFIILYNKEDKKIYCANALAAAFAAALAFVYYTEKEWMNKISVDQFRRVMDVTKGNYTQFEALTKRLGEMNKKNANV